MLAYNYWQRRFAGDVRAIGRKLAVNGYPLEIVGVAERGYRGVFNGGGTDLFVPVTAYPLTTPAAASVWNTPAMRLLSAPMGRLKSGVSIEKAQAEMRVLWPPAAEAVNDANVRAGGKRRDFSREEAITVTSGAHGAGARWDNSANPLTLLMAATSMVLLIACANIANLLLARATGRRKEIAIRLSVGATRHRLVRQLLAESLLLAGMGGVVGFVLARWTVAAIAAAQLVRPNLTLEPSLALGAFSAGATLFTGVVFGLAPALRATRSSLVSQVGSRVRLGKVLVAAQAALSLVLMVGAGLFLQTMRTLQKADLGFERERIVLVDVDAARLGYGGQRLRTFYDQLLDRTRGLRGVRSASLAGMTPMGPYAMSMLFSAEGYQPRGDDHRRVLHDYGRSDAARPGLPAAG